LAVVSRLTRRGFLQASVAAGAFAVPASILLQRRFIQTPGVAPQDGRYLASGDDPQVTRGYADFLEASQPAVQSAVRNLRKGVALATSAEFGSAILVRVDLTGARLFMAVLCAHQVPASRPRWEHGVQLTFYPSLGIRRATTATVVYLQRSLDANFDVAIAILDNQKFVEVDDLVPVPWEASTFGRNVLGNAMFVAGFPDAAASRLHIEQGAISDFKATAHYQLPAETPGAGIDVAYRCKFFDGPFAHGLSGGLVADARSGATLGMCSLTTGGYTPFSPVIRGILYGVAARLTGQPVPDLSQRSEAAPLECVVPDSSFSLVQRLPELQP
jgi:hypothetical protein